jgi:predicted dehydrogenase
MTHHNPSPLRFGIVGYGGAVRRAAQAIELAGQTLVGVADRPWDTPRAEAAAREMASDLATQPYASVDDLLPDVEALHLACAAGLRRRYAVTAFGKRVPVISEAPLAADLGEASRIVREAERTGVVNATSLPARHLPPIVAVRDHLPTRALGAPHSVHARLTRRQATPAAEQCPAPVPRDDSGSVPTTAELATLLDVVEQVAGEPVVKLTAALAAEPAGPSRQREDVCLISLASGAVGTVTVSLGGEATEDAIAIRAVFEQGEFRAEGGEFDLRLSAQAQSSIPVVPSVNPHASWEESDLAAELLARVCQDIRAGQPSAAPAYPTFVDGYRCAKLIAAVAASAKRGSTVEL